MKTVVWIAGVHAIFLWNLCSADVQEINTDRKVQNCQQLVDEAVTFFAATPLADACRAFIKDVRWRKGELEIFVFDEGGICYAFGTNRRYLWKDFQTKKTLQQEDFIARMIAVGQQGGFVSFLWENGYIRSFVRTVAKDGRMFIIGSGFYPASGRYITEQIVGSALDYAATNPLSSLIERINNPTGMFVSGDIYVTLFDMRGVCVANGRNIELVGQNLINELTDDGKYRTRDILKIAKSPAGRGWYHYRSKAGGVKKSLYIERMTTSDGTQYALVGGYYPGLTEGDTRGMVKKALSYMRAHGSKQAFAEFSQPGGKFAYGGVQLFVYDLEGTIVADMANPAFVGQNLSNAVDVDGRFIVKIILSQAERYTSGWVSFHIKNAYAMMYIEKVKLPDGDFVVGASYYPMGKQVTVRFFVEKAARHIEQVPKEEALDHFVNGSSDFLRGDVWVSVFSEDGVLLANGADRSAIWDKDLSEVDDKGRSIVKKTIAIAQSGGGWLEYLHNNGPRRVYSKMVSKKNSGTVHSDKMTSQEQTAGSGAENLIVVSGYYL